MRRLYNSLIMPVSSPSTTFDHQISIQFLNQMRWEQVATYERPWYILISPLLINTVPGSGTARRARYKNGHSCSPSKGEWIFSDLRLFLERNLRQSSIGYPHPVATSFAGLRPSPEGGQGVGIDPLRTVSRANFKKTKTRRSRSEHPPACPPLGYDNTGRMARGDCTSGRSTWHLPLSC